MLFSLSLLQRTKHIFPCLYRGTEQPDSGTDGQCVVMYDTGFHWFDTWCGEDFAFSPICEKNAPTPEEQEKLKAIWQSRDKWQSTVHNSLL